MNRLRDPRWFLILAFLATLATVPLVQLAIELRQGEGVRALELFGQTPTAAHLRAFERNLEEANWAAQTTRPWLQFALFETLQNGGAKAVVGQDGWYFYKPGLNYVLSRPEPTHASGTTNDPLPAILDFRDQLAARGIRLLVMPVPNKESIYPDRLTPGLAAPQKPLAPRTADLLRRLRAAQVDVVDLFEEFGRERLGATTARSNAPLYLAQDTHWSPAGARLAARTVARRLLELGWTTRGTTDYLERPAPVQRLGDILRMMRVPPIEQRIPPEAVPTVQIVARETNAPYQDSPNSDILILGDSFMRIYERDEPESAGFVAHLARELGRPLLSLVNDGGGATLVRRELRARPGFIKGKKIVVWEFVERDIGLAVEGWKPVALLPPESTTTTATADSRAPAQRGSGQ